MEVKTSNSYQKEVLAKYKREKGGMMSMYLAQPTSSQIRQACIWLLDKRNDKHDELILNRFFQFKHQENKLKEIQNFDEGKFKTLVNFLTGKTKKTSPKNLELISWLIDFQPRPYEEYSNAYSHSSISEEPPLGNLESEIFDESYEGDENSNDRPKINKEEERKKQEEIKKEKRRKLVITIGIAFGAILTTTLIFKDQIFTRDHDSPSNNEAIENPVNPNINTQLFDSKCMTWADSLYITISCDESPLSKYGTQVKPIDKMKLKNMRKVEVDAAYQFFTDTGKPRIWYYKNENNEYEFFTAPGLHPVTDETLKKITPYIIHTYVPIHLDKKESFVPE